MLGAIYETLSAIAQRAYEAWDKRTLEDYKIEIDGAAPVYDHIRMSGRIIDVGGGAGTVRHYLPQDAQFIYLKMHNSSPLIHSSILPRACRRKRSLLIPAFRNI